MSREDSILSMLVLACESTAPGFAARTDVVLTREAVLFEVEPRGARVQIAFGFQLLQQPANLMHVVGEAMRAAEEMHAGRTKAARLTRRPFARRQQVLEAIALSMRARQARRQARKEVADAH